MGCKLAELNLAEHPGCAIVSVLRGKAELYSQPGLVLEAGDQLRVVTKRGRCEAVQTFLRSAQQFVVTVQEIRFLLLGVGILITLSVVLLALLLGTWFLRLPFDDLLGVVAGVTGNPAILAYVSRAVPTQAPELGYAIVFPTSTIVKIIMAQIVASFLIR